MRPDGGRLAAVVELLVEEIVERVAARQASAEAPRVEGFIGTREAARRAGVKQDTLLTWIAKDVLPATRIEGSKGWKIRPADLAAVLSGQSRGLQPANAVDLAAERGKRLALSVPRRGDEQ